MDFTPLFLSLKLASAATIFIILLSAPLAYLLAFSRLRGKAVVECLVCLPMALPPTVVGFYLLLLMGPGGILGRGWVALTGTGLLFTFPALVMASIVYGIGFAIQPMKTAFNKLDFRLIESAYVLGLSRPATFFRVILPNTLSGIAASAVLVFLHTIGMFGILLMVGGSMPGKTRVVSIAIYEAVETLNYRQARLLSLAVVPLCFLFVLLANRLNRAK